MVSGSASSFSRISLALEAVAKCWDGVDDGRTSQMV